MAVEGVLPVVPTPFRDGRFDPDSFARLLDHMLPETDGYTLLGSSGEAPSLTLEQRMEIAAAALAMTPPGKDVVVGISHTSVADARALAQHAQSHGARAVLCCVPYYFPNTADGILRYLTEIDETLEIDLVLYDNPVTTKSCLSAEWVVRWAEELEHLRSVKLTDHDLAKVSVWHAAGLSVLAGDDPILFQYLSAGVDGAMVLVPTVLPRSFRAAWELTRAGDLTGALAVYSRELVPFIQALGLGDEIATTKALLADIGIFASAEVLSPLRAIDCDRRQLLRHSHELGREAALLRESQRS